MNMLNVVVCNGETAKALKRPRESKEEHDEEEAYVPPPPPVKRVKKDYEWLSLLNVLKDILARLEDVD